MGGHYINFYFRNVEYDDGYYGGEFSSPDSDVYCEFLYGRKAQEFIGIWNNSKPVDEIMPIPIWWLDRRLQENGELRKSESRICY